MVSFFDLIVIDECHRGSASEDSAWREILEYFGSATQIGLTATPKETEEVSSTDYFGDPVYTYSLKEGIEDGLLAPYKVVRVDIDVDVQGWRPVKLVVLDQNIQSMTKFKQIIGRGTRINEKHGKLWFTILDFKKATELFADPRFDGLPEKVLVVKPDDISDPASDFNDQLDAEDNVDGDENVVNEARESGVESQHRRHHRPQLQP